MPYCTRADLEARLGPHLLRELTDLETTGAANDSRIQQAILDASAQVDAYAAMRYPVPFSPVPEFIRRVAIDLAVHRLFEARGFDAQADGAIVEAHRAAIRFLEHLAAGRVSIGAAQPPKDQGASLHAAERRFTRDRMEDF